MKKIIFIGDSITANFTELKRHQHVLNKGVSGDRTTDVIERLYDIKKEDPEEVFLMIGINDLLTNNHIWFTDFPISITTTYDFIVQYLIKHLNTKRIILFSILPISSFVVIKRDIEASVNEQIDEMNIYIKSLADQHNLTYIDLNQHYKGENRMKKAYTTDGVHLTKEGYELFYKKIQSFLI